MAAAPARPETSAPPKSAGDMLADRADLFVQHVRACKADDCAECANLLGQMGIAHDVWKRSEHKAVTRETSAPPALASEPDVLFMGIDNWRTVQREQAGQNHSLLVQMLCEEIMAQSQDRRAALQHIEGLTRQLANVERSRDALYKAFCEMERERDDALRGRTE